MPRLLVEKGPDRGKSLTIAAGQQVVAGRDKSADLQLSDNMASRRHFLIGSKGSVFGLKDLKSANGTLVNGKRADGARKLSYGDSIQIGETLISWLSDEQSDKHGGLIGQQIGGYRIEERLGRGAMGTVYKATQLSLGRTIALKVLAEDLAKDEKFCEMFLKEARAAGGLNHPNIIQVYDVGDEGDKYYFSMEFASKDSVQRELSATRSLPIPRAVRIIMDSCAALDYAERKGLVHRDIKPDNLMVTEDGTVKLGDLGLAMSAQELQGEQEGVFGTPHYIAPEQAMGKPIDHRADIYALGASFYRIVAGRTMFRGTTVKEILKKQVRETPPPITEHVPDCPKAIQTVIERMLAKNPAERYQHASDIIADLQNWESQSARMSTHSSMVFGGKLSGRAPEDSQMVASGGSTVKLILAGVIALICVIAAGVTVYVVAFGDDSNRKNRNTPIAGSNQPGRDQTGMNNGRDDPLPPEVLKANENLKASITVARDRLSRDGDAPDAKAFDDAVAYLQDELNKYVLATKSTKSLVKDLIKEIQLAKVEYEQGAATVNEAWEDARREALDLIDGFKFVAAGESVTQFLQQHEGSPNIGVQMVVGTARTWLNDSYPARSREKIQFFEKTTRQRAAAARAEKHSPEKRYTLMKGVIEDVTVAQESCDDPTYSERLTRLESELKETLGILRKDADRAEERRMANAFNGASASLNDVLTQCADDIAGGDFKNVGARMKEWESSNADFGAYRNHPRFKSIRNDIKRRKRQTQLEHAALRALDRSDRLRDLIDMRRVLKDQPWPDSVVEFLGDEDVKFYMSVDPVLSDEQWTLFRVEGLKTPEPIKPADLDADQRRLVAQALSHLIMNWEELREAMMEDAAGLPALVGLFAWMSEFEAYDAAFPLIKHAFENTQKDAAGYDEIREFYAWGLLGQASALTARDKKDEAAALIQILETRFADTRANRGR